MNPRKAQAVVDTAWQVISSTVTAPLRMVTAVADHVPGSLGKALRYRRAAAGADRLLMKSVGPVSYVVCTHRNGKRLDASYRSDPERLNRVLSLLGPFFERELLCVIGAGCGPLCAAGILLEGFQRVVATEHDPNDFDLLNANLLLNHLGDRVTTFHARCGAPQRGLEGAFPHAWPPIGWGAEAAAAPAATQVIAADRLAPWATPGSALVWISARSLQPDTLDGARGLVQRGVPLLVGVRRAGAGDAVVVDALRSTLSGTRYTHCYHIGPRDEAVAIDAREFARVLRRPEFRGGATDLLFF